MVEIECPVRVGFLAGVAVEYRCGDDGGVIRICAADGEGLSVEVYICVARSGVDVWL
jgi:hypothetical protein